MRRYHTVRCPRTHRPKRYKTRPNMIPRNEAVRFHEFFNFPRIHSLSKPPGGQVTPLFSIVLCTIENAPVILCLTSTCGCAYSGVRLCIHRDPMYGTARWGSG